MSDPTMGAYLRKARRRRRVSIDRAAEQTRIRADYLMRMESDEFDFLAPAYVRGFLKSYARFLRVDPDPLVEEFDRRFGRARADTSQIIALERRSRSVPRQRRRMNSWTVAAALAATIIIGLMVIGIVNAPEEAAPPSDNVVEDDGGGTPTETRSPSETPSPTPTPTPTPTEPVIAFDDGIELRIVAARGDCWIDVTADGTQVDALLLYSGERATFTAEGDMDVVLGLPESVDLIVNGINIGSPGGTDPTVVHLPEDVESL